LQLHNEFPEAYDYFDSLGNIMLDSSSTLTAKISLIKDFETNFDFTGLSTEQIHCLFAMSSIARYSLFLWAPKSMGGMGKFDNVIVTPGRINWPEIGAEDALGCYGAALFTWNPWTALGGGAVASCFAILKEVI